MAISFSYQKEDFELNESYLIKKWIVEVVRRRNCRVGNISYLFCDDEYVYDANVKFLQHDTFTDIITFDYVEGDVIAGDIMISVDRVMENALIFHVPFDQELHRVIIHGILHLLGQGDKSDSEAVEMRAKEDDALSLWSELFS